MVLRYKIAAGQATKLQACCHTGNRTTSLQPHRRYKKLHAWRHTGVTRNYKLSTTQATKVQACCHTGMEQNYKLTATQAKTTSLSPHRRNTKLQACRHTGNRTTSLQPYRGHTKLQACRHTGNKTTSFIASHRRQNYKLAATQGYCILVTPQTKLQNYMLTAPQA